VANGSNSVSVLFQAELRVLASGGQILSGPPLAPTIVTQAISMSSVAAGGSGLRSVATAPENRRACEAVVLPSAVQLITITTSPISSKASVTSK